MVDGVRGSAQDIKSRLDTRTLSLVVTFEYNLSSAQQRSARHAELRHLARQRELVLRRQLHQVGVCLRPLEGEDLDQRKGERRVMRGG